MNILEKYKTFCDNDNATIPYDEQVNYVNAYMGAIDTLLKGKVDKTLLHNISETIKGIEERCPDISKDEIQHRIKKIFDDHNVPLPTLEILIEKGN